MNSAEKIHICQCITRCFVLCFELWGIGCSRCNLDIGLACTGHFCPHTVSIVFARICLRTYTHVSIIMKIQNALKYFVDWICCQRFGYFFQNGKRIRLIYLTKRNARLAMIYEDLRCAIGQSTVSVPRWDYMFVRGIWITSIYDWVYNESASSDDNSNANDNYRSAWHTSVCCRHGVQFGSVALKRHMQDILRLICSLYVCVCLSIRHICMLDYADLAGFGLREILNWWRFKQILDYI